MSKDETANEACVRGASGFAPGPRARVSPSDSAQAPHWFRPRQYRHLDVPVGPSFASRVIVPEFVAQHPFSPLISYVKTVKRYKSAEKKTVVKPRDIMYASHRDACIYSYYSAAVSEALELEYEKLGLSSSVIAYRKLGKANYHFAAEALQL